MNFYTGMRVMCIDAFQGNSSIVGKAGFIYGIGSGVVGVCFDDCDTCHGPDIFTVPKEDQRKMASRCWNFVSPEKYLVPISSITII